MATYLFSLGLVPVQSWIAEARRSRDLRTGSVFLWRTMAKLLARLQENHAGKILLPRETEETGFKTLADLPFHEALSKTYGIPNRAAGYLEASDEDVVKEIFRALRSDVLLRTWQTLKTDHLRETSLLKGVWDLLNTPVEAYLERTKHGGDCPLSLLWVARKLEGERKPTEDLKAIERLFADVKRTRPVEAWTAGSYVGKCNQCGRREAMGPDGDFSEWQKFHTRLRENLWVKRGVRIDSGERLCYVCFTRRLAGYPRQRTPVRSTGEVAAHFWERKVNDQPQLEEALRQLKAAVKDSEDGYGGGDVYRALHAQPAELKRLGLDDVAKKRQALFDSIDTWNRDPAGTERIAKRPPSYLAVLAFDGDDMGEWIADNYPGGADRLSVFAHEAAEMFRGQGAEIFYLAGDEGLVMLPVASALAAAAELRESFQRIVAEGGDKPSLSAGLAFFEHSRPMAGAIRAARSAIEAAKAMKEKNSLGAAVETASGSRWRFVEHWGPPWDRIRDTVAHVRDRKLAAGWAYDVERLLNDLPLDSWEKERWGDDRLRNAVLAEIERLFVRRCSSEVGKTPAKRSLWQNLEGPDWWSKSPVGEVPPPHPEQFHLIGFLASHAADDTGTGGEAPP